MKHRSILLFIVVTTTTRCNLNTTAPRPRPSDFRYYLPSGARREADFCGPVVQLSAQLHLVTILFNLPETRTSFASNPFDALLFMHDAYEIAQPRTYLKPDTASTTSMKKAAIHAHVQTS